MLSQSALLTSLYVASNLINICMTQWVWPDQISGWLQIGAHHGVFDYARRNNYPKGEVAVYTWQDASLRELTELVKEVGACVSTLCFVGHAFHQRPPAFHWQTWKSAAAAAQHFVKKLWFVRSSVLACFVLAVVKRCLIAGLVQDGAMLKCCLPALCGWQINELNACCKICGAAAANLHVWCPLHFSSTHDALLSRLPAHVFNLARQ